MKTCPNCSEKFDDSENYCLRDGTPLNTSFPVGRLAPPSFGMPRKTNSQYSTFTVASVITVVVFLIVGAAGVGAIYFLRSVSGRGVSAPPPYNAAPPYNNSANSNNQSANESLQFAREIFRFGSEGIGAGQFQSINSVTVDANGKIYVSDGRPGRVQIFDAEGKFLTQWTPPDKELTIEKLVINRNGTGFGIQGSSLLRLESETGKQTGLFIKSRSGIFTYNDPLEFIADDVAITLDGNLRVLVGGGTILKMNADGKTLGKIVNAPKIASYSSRFKQIALDGLGNIYALSDHNCYIFKFSDEGKFINRFGSKSSGSPSNIQPGQCFTSFDSLVVDGKGRVFVSDSLGGVSVFDGDGKVVGSFKPKDSISNMFFTDKNELWASSRNSVVKFEVNQ